jgi:hypothetical protein
MVWNGKKTRYGIMEFDTFRVHRSTNFLVPFAFRFIVHTQLQVLTSLLV